MKLYRLFLLQKMQAQEIPIQGVDTTYWTYSLQPQTQHLNVLNTQEAPLSQEEQRNYTLIDSYNLLFPSEVEKIKREKEIRIDMLWITKEEDELVLSQELLTTIRNYRRFHKSDCIGRKNTFFCKTCQERVSGYVIRHYQTEMNMKENTLLVSFCFICQERYFIAHTTRKIAPLISFAKKALEDAVVTMRIRGGSRVALESAI